MKLPQLLSHSPLRSVRRIAPQALLRLEGFEAAPRASWAGRTLIALARGHCRLRWFRLAGLPSAERFAALRLQVEAWRPFDELAARLAVSGEEGLAIAWDAAAVRAHLVAAGLSPERCQVVPEVLLQAPGADGLRLLQGADGFEAQCWRDGWLRASRWWAQALTVQDWQEFVHASGGDVATPMPPAEVAALVTTPWARHLPLDASADGADGTERRLVFAGGLALAFAGGLLAHQFWDVRQEGQALAAQIADVKQTTGPVLQARDATMAALDEVDKLAAWYAVPLPVDVVGQLHDTLARSGVQVKDLDLEGSKLRLGLLLSPTATRAGIVKDLQSGGWFTDVVEVRADNARGMVTMEMRIAGPRPPVGGAAPAGVVADSPLPAAAVSPSPVMAPAPVTVPRAAAPAPAASAQAPAPAPVQPPPARAPAPPREPAKPIIAKPDANGMPPPDVFNAVPNR